MGPVGWGGVRLGDFFMSDVKTQAVIIIISFQTDRLLEGIRYYDGNVIMSLYSA